MTDTMELFGNVEVSNATTAEVAKAKRSGKKVSAGPKVVAVQVKPASGPKIEKTARLATPKSPALTKSELVLKKLGLAKGVTIEMLMEATGWQAHSVRGFLSGTVKKKLGHALMSEVGKDGLRRYRIDGAPAVK